MRPPELLLECIQHFIAPAVTQSTLYSSQAPEDSIVKPQVEWVKEAARLALPVEDCDVLMQQKIPLARVQARMVTVVKRDVLGRLGLVM